MTTSEAPPRTAEKNTRRVGLRSLVAALFCPASGGAARYASAIAAAYAVMLAVAVSFSAPRRVGDGGEYVVMAYRLAGFQPPVVTPHELEEHKASLRALGAGFESSLVDYPTMVGADGRQAFLHFWLYPLFAVPGVWIAQLFGLHPNWAFTLTNLGLLTGAAFVVGRAAPLIGVVYVFVGPIIWWVDKAHTEAFLFAAVAIATICIESSPAAALVSFALAGGQNAALGVLYPIFAGLTLVVSRKRRPWTTREYIAGLAGAVIVALPLVYNWMRVGRMSPMAEYAHFSVPSPAGLIAFLAEPNIGIIFNAPSYLLALLGLAVVVVRGPARSAWIWWWPAIIQILLLLLWSQNPNANHGGTPGVNRWVLSLLPLSLPWAIGAYASYTPALRRAVAAATVALAAASAYWHLPSRPENYLYPTAIGRTLWTRGWLYVTPAEVFAERTAHAEAPALPVADEDCDIALVWGMQSPVTCVPPAAQFPAACEGVDAFCFAAERGETSRAIHASYNGFFYRPATRSWPAAGPLASGVRRVLLSLDPSARRWEIADERRWVRERQSVEVPVMLERHGRLFVYIARTGASPSLVLRTPGGAEAALHTLIPLQQMSTAAAAEGTVKVALPGDASNLAVTVIIPH